MQTIVLAVACTLMAQSGLARSGLTQSGLAADRQAEQARTLQIEGFGQSEFPLDAPWQFHAGDNPAWASPDFDDSQWEQLTATRAWGLQGHPSYSGFAWYRLRLRLIPAPGASTSFALLVPPIDDVYEIYWNGQRIGGDGMMPPHPVWLDASRPPSIFALGASTQGTLAIRVWKSPPLSDDSGTSGGFRSAPIVGHPDALAAHNSALEYRWLSSHQFAFGEYLLYATIGVFCLVGWLRDRRQWIFFWMTGFSLAPVLRLILFGLRIAWPVALANGVGEPISSMRDIALWFLLLWLLHLHGNRRLVRLTGIFAIISFTANTLDGLLLAFDASASWYWLVQIADAVFTAAYFITATLPLVLVILAVRQRRRLDSGRWFLAMAAFLSGMVQVVALIAPQGSRFTHWTLSESLDAPLFSFRGNEISLATLTGLLLLVAVVYVVYRTSMENRLRQAALEQELHSARELQQVLIPEALPSIPGFALTSAYRPAQEVGGDFFQIIPLEGNATLVILGDVSGKGLKAAMAVSLIVGLIRALADQADRKPGPAYLLQEINRRLCGRLQGGFTTCVALLIDPDGQCTVASAGHPAPFLNRQEVELPGSFPLGIMASTAYEDFSIQMSIGDRLAIYTDGLPEARTLTGELYGFHRIETLLSNAPNAAEVTEAAVRHGQDDDITVVILTRVRQGEESATLETVAAQA